MEECNKCSIDYCQAEFLKIKYDIQQIKQNLEHLNHDNSAWQKNLTSLEFELCKLHSKLEEVFNDRKEDRETIQALMKELEVVKKSMVDLNIYLVEVKTNQKNTLEKMATFKEMQDKMDKKLDEINKNTNINWVEWVKNSILAKLSLGTLVVGGATALASAIIYYIKQIIGG